LQELFEKKVIVTFFL